MIAVEALGVVKHRAQMRESTHPPPFNTSQFVKFASKLKSMSVFFTTFLSFLVKNLALVLLILHHSTPFKLSFPVIHWLSCLFLQLFFFTYLHSCTCVWVCDSGKPKNVVRLRTVFLMWVIKKKGLKHHHHGRGIFHIQNPVLRDSVIMLRYTIKNFYPFFGEQSENFNPESELAQNPVCGEWRHISSNFSPRWSFC